MEIQVVVVASLWRYPVKSLLGERLDRAAIEPRGVAYDRLFAVRDEAGRFGSGKTTRRFRRMEGLFALRARLEGDTPVVGFPDGRLLHGGDPAVHAALSAHVGQPVTLAREDAIPHFDAGAVHLVTTAALRALGGADERRLRPNLVIDCPGHGFVEHGWLGAEVQVGDEVRLRVTTTTERCAMVGFAQGELEEAPALLRELATRTEARLGVYAEVLRPGTIRLGDAVRVSHSSRTTA